MNGLSQTKLDVYQAAGCIQTLDLALLAETRCEESDVLHGYGRFSLPLVNPGVAGEGTRVLVHPRLQGSVSLWKLQPEAQAVWVHVRASDISLNRDVFIACVYIPPAGSAQLLSQSLSERMSSKAAVTSAKAHGHVILGGDVNARVEGMFGVLVPESEFLKGLGIP